jgi:hypothetical protein
MAHLNPMSVVDVAALQAKDRNRALKAGSIRAMRGYDGRHLYKAPLKSSNGLILKRVDERLEYRLADPTQGQRARIVRLRRRSLGGSVGASETLGKVWENWLSGVAGASWEFSFHNSLTT